MPRIVLSPKVRDGYFLSLKEQSKLPWEAIATRLQVSGRHFRNLRSGKHTLSLDLAKKIERVFKITLPKEIEHKKDKWHLQDAAKKGGLMRFKLYGSPATPEGRKKGGINSLITHYRNKTGFKVSKNISLPSYSESLAELLGAFLGDGTLTRWQAKIYLNLKTDAEYALYLKSQIEKLFEINVTLSERAYNSTIDVVVSSTKLVQFLHDKGMPIGNKIKQNLDIPKWIFTKRTWQEACLRGLFDTDGCTYIDHHKYKDRRYANIALAFASASNCLLESIYNMLESLGYSPTKSTRQRVLLRKESEVIKFFQEIAPNCKRHQSKLREYFGGVPKWS